MRKARAAVISGPVNRCDTAPTTSCSASPAAATIKVAARHQILLREIDAISTASTKLQMGTSQVIGLLTGQLSDLTEGQVTGLVALARGGCQAGQVPMYIAHMGQQAGTTHAAHANFGRMESMKAAHKNEQRLARHCALRHQNVREIEHEENGEAPTMQPPSWHDACDSSETGNWKRRKLTKYSGLRYDVLPCEDWGIKVALVLGVGMSATDRKLKTIKDKP
ncbi:MAG: hypothetical protein FRX49_09733 [Trebouxia sp. A1-2]|nr:MAG: hypothetical protein FRX49_09733 [Trebouxia sp. A1-2]